VDATTASPQAPAKEAGRGADTLIPTIAGDYSAGARALMRITRMALRYRVRFPAAIVTVIAAGVFQLLIPRYLGQAVDHATGMLAGSAASAAPNGTSKPVELWSARMSWKPTLPRIETASLSAVSIFHCT